MTIFVDQLQTWPSGPWCHLWMDDGTEDSDVLHLFAESIGLKRKWSQCSRSSWGSFYHYDLRPSKRVLAIASGAVEREFLEFVKEMRSKTT